MKHAAIVQDRGLSGVTALLVCHTFPSLQSLAWMQLQSFSSWFIRLSCDSWKFLHPAVAFSAVLEQSFQRSWNKGFSPLRRKGQQEQQHISWCRHLLVFDILKKKNTWRRTIRTCAASHFPMAISVLLLHAGRGLASTGHAMRVVPRRANLQILPSSAKHFPHR